MKEKYSQSQERQSSEVKKIRSLLTEGGSIVSGNNDLEGLSSRGYGTPEKGKLALNCYETLYLQSKGELEVRKARRRKPLSFQGLLHHFESAEENVWARYLIYRDLRSRGYVVREGFGLGIDFRVYSRGDYGKDTAAYLVLGIQEGKPISVEKLARILRHVQSLKKKLVLAVVNRRGETVYYTLSKLTMR